MSEDYRDRSRYYSCYSTRIYEHLIKNGFVEHTSFLNIKTKKHCKIFILSPELSACIAEVSNPKP